MTTVPRRAQRRRARRIDPVLLVAAAVFVVVAVGIGVTAFLVYSDASATRDATKPLEVRTALLRRKLSSFDVAIDRLTVLFAAIRAQAATSNAAVAATNKAADQYNNAQAGLAATLGGDATTAVDELTKATAVVRTAVAGVNAVPSALGSSGG